MASFAFSFSKFYLALLLVVLVLGSTNAQLSTNFYSKSCPNLLSTVKSIVHPSVSRRAPSNAFLVRVFFHDCFVNGCDGSLLLDDTSSFTGEKTARANRNLTRGFDVVDNIKSAVEKACPGVVSCADILAIAARDSVVGALGGPNWDVKLGRRDTRTASRSAANNGIPAPTSNLDQLISTFNALGLTTTDVAALFGSRNNNLAPLDVQIDNKYFNNLVSNLHSDQQLFNSSSFNSDFAAAMIKMGDISPLTGSSGEVRKNCKRVN